MSHSHGDHAMMMNAAVETTTHNHDMMTTHNHNMMTTHNHDMMTTHNHGGNDAGNGTVHMMMMMYFHFGNDETVLFEGWKIDDVGKMVGSVIGIFLMAILYEGLKYFRESLNRKNMVAINYSTIKTGEGNGSVTHSSKKVTCRTSMLSSSHFIQTLLHLVQLILSYFLMLIVMTYNVWLCLAVVVGCTVGYFLFGWQKSYVVDITEHCH